MSKFVYPLDHISGVIVSMLTSSGVAIDEGLDSWSGQTKD